MLGAGLFLPLSKYERDKSLFSDEWYLYEAPWLP